MYKRKPLSWTVIILTCQHKDSVYAFQRELEVRQKRGSIPQHTLLLTVPDPQERLGSGGATLNALLVAAEHLSAKAGYSVVTADVLEDAHVLVLHTGRDFPWDSCGRAFCWMPVGKVSQTIEGPVCCLDRLLDVLSTQLCPGSPPGVWVCSTDSILTLPPDYAMNWEGFNGVRVISLPGDPSFAANHGVYLADKHGRVCDIIYKGTQDRIHQATQSDGKVPLVSGPVFFSRDVAERLLETHVTPPLDGCTYMGMDSGAPPLQISLYLDILMCLCLDLSESDFVNGERQGCSSPTGAQGAAVRSARAVLWRLLRGTPLGLVYVRGGCYDYLTISGREHINRLTKEGITERDTLSHIERTQSVNTGGRVINCVLEGEVKVEAGTVIQHCHLQGPVKKIPSGCLISGIERTSSLHFRQLTLPSDVIIQGHRILLGELKITAYTILGAHDDLEIDTEDESATFLNQPWNLLYTHKGIQPDDLWGFGDHRCLMEARLFPVFRPRGGPVGLDGGVSWLLGGLPLEQWRGAWRLSLREVQSLTHQETELWWREEMFALSGRRRVTDALQGQSDCSLLPTIKAAVLGGQQGELLSTLDTVAKVAAGNRESLGVAARCLACVADVLGCMAGEGRGGLRSGPAANPAWKQAFSLLEQGNLPGGITAMATQRLHWLSRPDLLVRAARHYEGAGQVLLRQAVMTAQRFVSIGQGQMPPYGEWQEVECPARLDFAGGWSDTPPIAFEHGGSVVNVAVQIDGRRPIGARARRIKEPRLILVSHSGGHNGDVSTETVCERLEDLKDHCQPHAPGALLKAVCVCSGLVSFPSMQSLEEQLLQRWGGGVELHSWSRLPHGSGLGTSSILAGALLAACYSCSGRTYDTDSLIHAVLHLEQMLTTGGGWQDQVGGLVGGIKCARSKASLPLRVEVERLAPSQEFLVRLQDHLLLVYTGKTRLARNLLQDVVRSWYSRHPAIVENAKQLVANAEDCARACTDGSLSRLGVCLDRSWQQKKVMAPGCEPSAVRTMMDVLRPLALGMSLAGAGGGGFLYLLTRSPQQGATVHQVLNGIPGLGDYSIHSVEVDMAGISLLNHLETI